MDNDRQPDRTELDLVVNLLVPANTERGVPGASDLQVSEYLLMNSETRPDLRRALQCVIEHLRTQDSEISADALRQTETDLPAEFTVLLTETYKGYYSQPRGRSAVGVGAQAVHPLGYVVEAESGELVDRLTAPVIARGPCYRTTDSSGTN